jgi:hypothetical protein
VLSPGIGAIIFFHRPLFMAVKKTNPLVEIQKRRQILYQRDRRVIPVSRVFAKSLACRAAAANRHQRKR